MNAEPPSPAPRRRGPRPLAALVTETVGPAFSQRGFASADLIVHWPEIVGVRLARQCRPIGITWPKGGASNGLGATLTLACPGAFALDVQQMGPVLIERINRRLGWRCITRLAIRQVPLRALAAPVRPEPPNEADRAEAGRIVAGIQANDMRAALLNLGAAVKARARQLPRRAT
jgi:hypothetical protein